MSRTTMRMGIAKIPINSGIHSIYHRISLLPDRTSILPIHHRRHVEGKESLSFDFDQHLRRDQSAHLDHAGSGTDVREELAMGTSDFFPVVDIRDIDSSPYDISERCSSTCEGGFYVLQGLDCLSIGVTNADDLSVWTSRGRPGNLNPGADSHSPRVANNGLPCGARGDIYPFQSCFLRLWVLIPLP